MSTSTWQIAAAGLHDLAEEIGGDSARNLLARGFDIQGGNLIHNGVPIAPSYVAPGGGPAPVELTSAALKGRRTLGVIYERAWTKWFGYALKYRGNKDNLVGRLGELERNALLSGTGEGGGYLVPPTIVSGILSRMASASVVRQRATIVPTLSSMLVWPAFKPHSTDPSIYTTDFLAQWGPESPVDISATDPSFESFQVSVKRATTGLLRVSQDLVDDEPAALNFVIEAGGRNLALVTEAGLIAGNGTGLQPRGVLYSDLDEVDIEGTTSNTISNTTSAAGSADKLAALVSALPSQYRRNAIMAASGSAEAEISLLVDGNGNRMYRRGMPVEGLRLEVTPFLEASGTTGNRPVVVGDMSAVIVAQRSIEAHVIQLYETNEVGVVLAERMGSGVWNKDALRLGVL